MIDPDKIYSYIDDNHGPITKSTNGWYEAECPFCRSRKLYVHPDRNSIKCWKGCVRSSVTYFVKMYLACDYSEAKEILEGSMPRFRIQEHIAISPVKEDIALPDGFKPILGPKTPLGDRARNYLRARAFDMNYLDMIGIGYCDGEDYFGYIIIPFKKDGDIVYYIGRDFMDRGPKFRYKNPAQSQFGIGKSEVLFNEEALYLYDKVYLMEGWADAASIGNNGISIQGKSMSLQQWNIIKSSPVKEVVVISDLGAEKDALNILETLYKTKKTKLIKLTQFKDFGKDVNAIGAHKVLGLEDKTPYITTLDQFYHEARSINTRKKKLFN